MNSKVNADNKFPWPKGYAWNWNQEWHNNGYNKAIDVGTSNTNKFVLAVDDGQITNICNTNNISMNVTITHADGSMGYMHIEYGHLAPGIVADETVKKGQLIGKLKSGTWSGDNCGYANQNTNFAHIHWTFPDGDGWFFEGWELKDYDTSELIKDSTTIFPLSDLPISSNEMLIRNATYSSSYTYETKDVIKMHGDDDGLYIQPSVNQSIIFRTIY